MGLKYNEGLSKSLIVEIRSEHEPCHSSQDLHSHPDDGHRAGEAHVLESTKEVTPYWRLYRTQLEAFSDVLYYIDSVPSVLKHDGGPGTWWLPDLLWPQIVSRYYGYYIFRADIPKEFISAFWAGHVQFTGAVVDFYLDVRATQWLQEHQLQILEQELAHE